jgi:hypothetical protein
VKKIKQAESFVKEREPQPERERAISPTVSLLRKATDFSNFHDPRSFLILLAEERRLMSWIMTRIEGGNNKPELTQKDFNSNLVIQPQPSIWDEKVTLSIKGCRSFRTPQLISVQIQLCSLFSNMMN